MSVAPQPLAYTVTQLTQLIRQKLEQDVGAVWVAGEISNVRRQTSGITYFTLKDTGAQLNAVLFANVAATLDVEPADGMAVRVFGLLTVYAPQGKYQLAVRKMERAGQGELMARFEALKKKLADEGLFDRPRRPIPRLPRRIGIVTSPSGAALRDILKVLDRRFPNLDILIRGARVQGAGAAAEIALGIERLNAVGDPAGGVLPGHPRREVILVTRGGGSLEDLWPFNEEVVARAIAASRIPVISAVGHEIDFTISDFVADLRCPTPSAAAEQVIGRKEDFVAQLDGLSRRMNRHARHRLDLLRGRLAAARANRVFSEPEHAVDRFRQRIDHLEMRFQGSLADRLQRDRRRVERAQAALDAIRAGHLPRLRQALDQRLARMRLALDARPREARRRLDRLQARLQISQGSELPRLRRRIEDAGRRLHDRPRLDVERMRQRLAAAGRQLQALGPLSVLARGYSITRRADGRVVRSAADAPPGTRLLTRLAEGAVDSVVQ